MRPNMVTRRSANSTAPTFYFIASLLVAIALCPKALSATETPDFNRDILPMLTGTCFKCHGPDKEHREAGLRLDMRDSAIAKLESDAVAIVPGKPAVSELIRRITSNDPDERMPPPDAKEQLTPEQIETLRRWVADGAKYDKYWAYASIQKFDKGIDHYAHAKIEQAGLKPSPQADRVTLIRRLSFDIIGLPPSPQEVQAFVEDKSPNAYEKVVDRLLNSKHYGERMAMFWLDLVRFADTVGYHGDQNVSISPFRDYVINSFNDNMQFDQFTREQLAGDLLPNSSPRQKVASGYNRLGMMSAEGGVQPKEYLAKYAAERVRNVSLVWMGATMGCCECHDHKYDPYTMVDFYSMASFFADIQEKGIYAGAHASGKWGSSINYPDPELPTLLKPIDDQITQLQAVLNLSTPALDEAQRIWETNNSEQVGWRVLAPLQATAEHGTKLTIQTDKSILASAAAAPQNVYTVTAKTDLKSITGFRLEALPDKSLPKGGPGRAGNGNFVVSELRVFFGEKADAIALQNATATVEQTLAGNATPYGKWSAASAIDNDAKGSSWGWAILPEANKPNQMVVETKESIDGNNSVLKFVIEQNHTNSGHTLGKFRLAVTSAAQPLSAKKTQGLPENIRTILAVDGPSRTDKQKSDLTAHYRSIAPSLAETRKKIAALNQQKVQLTKEHTRSTLVTVAVKPRAMRVLPRGNWMDDSGPEVTPTVPHFLRQVERAQADKASRANRLDLANWLMSKDNPLTARVFVNRLWKLYFGRGLVSSLDDFGKQGTQSAHPEILDELASDFIDSEWDVKQTIKTIVTSSTYKQSSQSDEASRTRDPFNDLLARQGRYRQDAEMIRDSVLSVSGLLVRKIGGRSVRPYQPAGYYAHLNFPKRTYQHDKGENLWRRTVYTHWQRQFLHPSLRAFDAPSREECTVERARSNTPLAALVMLNDPIYVEASRAFAERTLNEAPKEMGPRISFVFQRALLREPSVDETKIVSQLLVKYEKDFREDPVAAKKLIDIGERPTPENLDAVELATWTGICRILFNTHEFITRN
jgi:mono/diheme cytochrome c family protein